VGRFWFHLSSYESVSSVAGGGPGWPEPRGYTPGNPRARCGNERASKRRQGRTGSGFVAG